ncbi:MAG: TetR/AcrR family transcriptional regulator [Mycobacteriaceae bacterium]|nr:TetR/AcrR family transcriptional regulator [Mycobacteriaceae bacterium]
MPVGREAVVAAILASAADLFAERGPAATSIRDIAARAKVNHGLVFRHFGAKQQLVGAVLNYLSAITTELVQSGASLEQLRPAVDRHTKVMARTLLDGYPAGQLQTSFPGAERMIELSRPRHDSDSSVRFAVANVLALQFGWRLFEPLLRAATGVELTAEELRQAVGAEIDRMGVSLP